ncbi:MAG: PilZ domain-containing protein [Desulfovibrio sp.]|jgi:c-di-GMP-binding flagellar brake protein YcgR|nr:PilZ domain-containing protein [Desulfovibrio sp.]
MEQNLERRQFSRIHLIAHGRGKFCAVKLANTEREAALIDISAGGARIKFPPPPLQQAVKGLVFSVKALDDGGLLQNLQATIRWRHEDEVGLQFQPELDVPLRVLQDLVS